MDRTMSEWSWVETPPAQAVLALLGPLTAEGAAAPATIERCRRLADHETVHRAIALHEARARAEGKLDDAAQLLLDRTATEQSTSTDVARHKARRFATRGIDRVIDLCSGIGGDAIGFALEGITPTLVDLDPTRLAAARHNVAHFLGADPPTVAADVAALSHPELPFHIDPDRRPGGKRTWRYADILPGPEVIDARIATGQPGAIKLGPGVAFEDLPEGEVEIIQRGRGLVQAVLWIGDLAEVTRRATWIGVDLGTPTTESFGGEPEPLPIGAAAPFLHTVEPAIERVGLLGTLARRHDLHAAHEHSGFLLGESAVVSPWLTARHLDADLPARLEDVRKWLRKHDGGIVTVRVRGGDEAREWEKSLRGKGSVRYTVYVTREGKKRRAWITRAVEEG